MSKIMVVLFICLLFASCRSDVGQKKHNLQTAISSVQSLSRVQIFATPWTAARQVSLSITNSQSFLKLMAIGINRKKFLKHYKSLFSLAQVIGKGQSGRIQSFLKPL